jgi:hypothetical protein
LIDVATGGPILAGARLSVDGINIGLNGANAGAGAILNRPWVFMFADGTPAPQDFKSAVAAPGGIATNTASSAGFLGSATSTATANGAARTLSASMASRGIASANALAGIGSTSISALPFRTALAMHLASIAVDPLSAPDTPIAQSPPPNAGSLPPFSPSLVPADAVIDAYLQNSSGDTYSLFHLKASLTYDSSDGKFDTLDLAVTGPGGSSSSLVTSSDFTWFSGPGGSGYQLSDKTLNIPYSVPSSWTGQAFTAALEIEAEGVSTNAVPEPASWIHASTAVLAGLGFCAHRRRRAARGDH